MTAKETECRFEVAVAKGHQLRILGTDFEYRFDAEAATPLTRTGRVGDVLVLD